MTRSTFVRGVAAGLGVVVVCPDAVRAHEKWFVDATLYPTDWGALVRFPGIVAVAVALAATLLAGRGRYAIDRLLFPRLEPSPGLAGQAMVSLRVATGVALTMVAFTEKLANPALARAFLQAHPLNFTPWLGLPMSDDLFVLCAGTTELIIGLCLIFGLFPRLVILTSWLFINMTLTIFNWVELVGHLPLYGVMGILLVWTPREEDQRVWVSGVIGEGVGRT